MQCVQCLKSDDLFGGLQRGAVSSFVCCIKDTWVPLVDGVIHTVRNSLSFLK